MNQRQEPARDAANEWMELRVAAQSREDHPAERVAQRTAQFLLAAPHRFARSVAEAYLTAR